MLVKFNSDQLLDDKILELQQHFNVGTASKACMYGATAFIPAKIALDNANKKIEELENILKTIKYNQFSIQESERVIQQQLKSFDKKSS